MHHELYILVVFLLNASIHSENTNGEIICKDKYQNVLPALCLYAMHLCTYDVCSVIQKSMMKILPVWHFRKKCHG
jgi:hypothetical protein